MAGEIVKPDPATPAPLSDADAERVQWVIEQIADNGLSPGLPGTTWAGRAGVVRDTMDKFTLSEADASRAVDLAHANLYQLDAGGGPAHVGRRLLKMRLGIVRKLVLQGLREEKVTTTYVFRRRKSDKVLIKVPKREQVKRSLDVNMVRMLIDIEQMLANVDQLQVSASDGPESVEEIFHGLSKAADGTTTETTTVKRRMASVPAAQLEQFSAAGQRVIEDAMRQERRKRVDAKEVVTQEEESFQHAKPTKQESPEGLAEVARFRIDDEVGGGDGGHVPADRGVAPAGGGPDATPGLDDPAQR